LRKAFAEKRAARLGPKYWVGDRFKASRGKEKGVKIKRGAAS